MTEGKTVSDELSYRLADHRENLAALQTDIPNGPGSTRLL